MRLVLARTREFNDKNIRTQFTAFGNKSLGVLTRMRAEVVSQAIGLGDKPELDRLIGAVKVQLDDFLAGRIDAVYIATNRFLNTMKQEPTFVRLLPLPGKLADPYNLASATAVVNSESETAEHGWDYIYEPDAQTVIDELLQRYVEGLVYQGVAESMASEQSARMVAMKAASDNAKKVIGDLQLVFNKTRQAAITKEISEIVGGAAAV
jgi:F-type H+-transporting ATPase subunit gamma